MWRLYLHAGPAMIVICEWSSIDASSPPLLPPYTHMCMQTHTCTHPRTFCWTHSILMPAPLHAGLL